ncbi:MAG: OmpA family protein [Gammaproteobacteria bacterium]|nr:OmpA family protein [Gammaproteobacteria bacterium]
MQKFVRKLGLMSLWMGLSVSAFATINGFDPSIKFPQKDKTAPFLKAHFYANESDLNDMAVGLTREQVRLLVGSSQLHASTVTAHSISYIFKFSELDKHELVCQYVIQFDEHQRVSGSYFDSQACVDHLHPPLPGSVQAQEASAPTSTPDAPATAPVALPDQPKLTIPSKMLFGFNQSRLKDLPESVKATLRTFADQLKANNATLDRVTITGYTDRIGDDAYNQKLSTARAETIKDYLVVRGVDAAKINTEGKGSAEPVVQCSETNRKKLAACLAPNRRVDIEFKQK